MNAIEQIITRDDLLDRCVIIRLPSIPERKRKDEETFWADFEEARPRILGALLDAVAVALKNHPHVKLESTPRMADFARWMTAAEAGLGWEPGDFMRAYTVNRASAVEMGIEASAVAQAIEIMTETVPEWQGTATELLDQLDKMVSDKVLKTKEWPKSPQSLSNRLRLLAPTMRAVDIEISFDREGHTGKRFIQIRKRTQKTVTSVTSVTQDDNPIKNNRLPGDDTGDDVIAGDDATIPASPSKMLKNNAGDDGDRGDDDLRLFSNPGLEGSI